MLAWMPCATEVAKAHNAVAATAHGSAFAKDDNFSKTKCWGMKLCGARSPRSAKCGCKQLHKSSSPSTPPVHARMASCDTSQVKRRSHSSGGKAAPKKARPTALARKRLAMIRRFAGQLAKRTNNASVLTHASCQRAKPRKAPAHNRIGHQNCPVGSCG